MNDFKRGMRDGIPIAMGYVPVSFTFGLMAVVCRNDVVAGVIDLGDESDLSRSVCRPGYHGSEWCLYGNGTDGIYHQSALRADVAFAVPEVGQVDDVAAPVRDKLRNYG